MWRRGSRPWPSRGICISAAVRDQVGDRLKVAYADLGEQQVKNITRPIRAYKVLIDGQASQASHAGSDPPHASPASAKKPSIAILPFDNMSGDPEQEFFVDGLTEDIITELSRFRELLVISRNAVFVHKGKPVKAKQVAREFGVDYIAEGSVRKAGDRVRVTIQLIDGETETHIWAERYDRKLEDIFAIQDEITSSIASTLFGRVEAARHDRAKRQTTANMAAYEYVLAGKILHHKSNREANVEALRALGRAIELDPNYAHAHAWMACAAGRRGCTAGATTGARSSSASLTNCRSRSRWTTTTPTSIGSCRAQAQLQRARQGGLSSGTRAEPQPQQRPHRRAAGRGADLARTTGRRDRMDSAGDAAQSYHPERFWSHLGRAHTLPALTPRRSPPTAAHCARPHASRVSGGVVGAAGNRQRLALTPTRCCRGSRRFGQARRHAALSESRRWGARARGPREGGIAGLGPYSTRPIEAPASALAPALSRPGLARPQRNEDQARVSG